MKKNTSTVRRALFIPFLLLLTLTAVEAQNCEVDGVTEFEWYFGREIPILDTARGVTFEATTTDIQSVAVSSSSTENALNGGPYVAVTYADNLLVVTLLEAFEEYEEHETLLTIQTDLVFTCTVATRILNIRHVITDTNNHAPQFLPSNQYEFTIFTPTGAGTPLTRLYTEIIVRDIDLTTSSIDFGIESNDMISISYLQRDSTDPKNFHALLETSSIIMGLDEAVNLQITATDVDGTTGPPITTNGTVVIDSDAQSLQLPTTPVFGQSIYTGSYSTTDGLVIEEEISLTDGFDSSVTFSLSGDHNEYFGIANNSNVVNIIVNDGIPDEVLYGHTHILLSLRALKDNTVGAWATIAITFPTEPILRFEEDLYKGTIVDNELQLANITVSEGYRDGVNFTLTGEYENLFSVSNENNIIYITLTTPLTDDILQVVNSINLILGASGQNSVGTSTVIILDIIKADVVHPAFSEPYYTGSYDPVNGLLMDSSIILSQGYDETVDFSLSGDHNEYFGITNDSNVVNIIVNDGIPDEVLYGNTHILLSLRALKNNTAGAWATIAITFPTEPILRFEENLYKGTIEDNELQLANITVSQGYRDGVNFTLTGEYENLFSVSNENNIIYITLTTPLTDDILEVVNSINLILGASGQNSVGTSTVIILDIIKADVVHPAFSEPYYTGSYDPVNGLLMDSSIILSQGYDETVNFTLSGDHSQHFLISNENEIVTLSLTSVPEADLEGYAFLVVTVLATKPGASAASAFLHVTLPDANTPGVLFSSAVYEGIYNQGSLSFEPIVLESGYSDEVTFNLTGELSTHFTYIDNNGVISITLASDSLPENVVLENTFIHIVLVAMKPLAITARTVLIITINEQANTPGVLFSSAVYEGIYNKGSLSFEPIVVQSDYSDEVTFNLTGELSTHFTYIDNNGVISITLASDSLPENVVLENTFIHIVLVAMKPLAITARTVLIITINEQANTPGVLFSSAVYEGIYNEGSLSFEPIVVQSGYSDEVTFNLTGELSTHFNYIDNNGVISITLASDSLPVNVVLENTFIHIVLVATKPLAITARTVLIITINELDITETPIITFQTSSLAITATSSQLGGIGTVSATASNGETIIYSLSIENEHLNERLQIDVYTGELSLSSYADIGNYDAIVTATTFITRVAVNTTVQINIENVTTCITNDHMLDPLIIISRDEEQAHQGLVTLNSASIGICDYSITNQYPNIDNWFYIDSSGSLSSNSIDREHSSIAFMVQSQVQIELALTCTGDEDITRNHSYSNLERVNNIARNEYDDIDGRFWILTEPIQHNIRRSLVNVIINDINDNYPIFEGKENEPVVIGYPNADIVGAISPPSFATVYATDADIGHNAHIMYSTTDSHFAIHPDSGVVYIRDNALDSLSDGDTVRVVATDQYGDGHSTYLDLEVRLLQSEHIVLITVKGAYLEDVNTIVSNLTSILQHEVRSLSSFVVPETQYAETRAQNNPTMHVKPKVWGHIDPKFLARNNVLREGETNEATLSIYVYALDADKTPVYASDIVLLVSENEQAMYWSVVGHSLSETVPVVSVVQVSSTSTSMLVSTIILSVLLVLLVLACIVWYFIIRKNNYKNFTDTSSDSSHRSSLQADFSHQPPSKNVLTTLPPNLSPNKLSPSHLPSNDSPPNNILPTHLPVTNLPPNHLPPNNLSPTHPPPTNLPHTPLYSTTLPPTSLSYPTPYTITFDDTNEQRARTYEKRLDPSNDKMIEKQPRNVSPTISNPSVVKDISSLLSYADETFVGLPTEKLDEVDEDEFGESKLKRKKSVVTFNEHVEKIHVEKIEAEPEIDDELEQEYHRL